MIETILVVAFVIACTVLYMRHKRLQRLTRLETENTSVFDILERRYARGEIDRDEYLQKKADIVGCENPAAGVAAEPPRASATS
jgi:uncharacterized membrane protein